MPPCRLSVYFLRTLLLLFLSTCIPTNLSYCLSPVCLHTNLSAAFFPLSLSVCQLGKVSTKWAECKQCPRYKDRDIQCPTADTLHVMCGQPSLFIFTPLCTCCICFCFCRPLLLFSSFFVLLLATSHFFFHRSFFSPSTSVSVLLTFLSSPPLPISPHQEEPNRKSKFLVEEWSGA